MMVMITVAMPVTVFGVVVVTGLGSDSCVLRTDCFRTKRMLQVWEKTHHVEFRSGSDSKLKMLFMIVFG
ncbi:hypothetical protein HanRHA438_Chr09g0399911 [Helianthus annuus]|nr:hypothetical protein HanRHA438_Chr09g0399911 [Helianthus annuus]